MNTQFFVPDVPAYITVHLGALTDDAENVTVSFPDYIKNVASGLLSPDMPPEALKAVIYAQISFALNRITNNFYRKQRYPFDITSDDSIDQKYTYIGSVYKNISMLVDEIFTEYIARTGNTEPILAKVCYGQTLRCNGLSVEESIELALNGRTAEEILRYYYGRDIYIEKNAILSGLETDYLLSYPINVGEQGEKVSGLQIALNRIASNYTTVPAIEDIDGIYDTRTYNAVSEFQRLFDMQITGNVDKATYHKLMYIYDSVRMLSFLVRQGENLSDIPLELRAELKYGSIGNSVKLLQYYLLFVSVFENRVPPLNIIGVFGEKTYQAVIAFQKVFGFNPDGVVTQEVWNALISVYEGLYASLPASAFSDSAVEYFGNILLVGSEGAEVRYLQEYLNVAADKFKELPSVNVTGFFDGQTEDAVKAFQRMFGIKESGVVSSTTWRILAQIYNAAMGG